MHADLIPYHQMDRMHTHVTAPCAGWDISQVRSIVEETLHDIVNPLVDKEAIEPIAEHHDLVAAGTHVGHLLSEPWPISELGFDQPG